MILQWRFIGFERKVGENFTQEKIRAGFSVKHHRILTNPADSCLFCESAFENGRAVDKCAKTKLADFRLNALSELCQTFAD